MKSTDSFTYVRAGHSVSGSITNLNIKRTMQNSLSRRIALKRPRLADIAGLGTAEIEALEDEDGKDGEKQDELRAQLEEQQRRSRRIPFIDPVDVRYSRFEQIPQPVTSAVMFLPDGCVRVR